MRVAVLGGGVMGETLASGLLRRLNPRPSVVVAEKRRERAEELQARHGVDLAEPATAVAEADVILLAVKPQDVGGLLDDISGIVLADALVISVCAGITTAFIEERLPAGIAVVRAMPNTPARVDRGTTGVSPGAACPPSSLATAVSLLESVGAVVEVPEALQDAVTAVSGSGPAYLFYLAEAMIEAGVDLGLDPATAQRLVHSTLLGAAVLLDVSAETAEELRRNVTSPNGTTAAAISTMDGLGVRQSVVSAITAARDRSRELSGG
ncbi:MAG: pyrroline-5-carboxylate reductase [Actinomycetota bacterium]|nr:pyrroline-5-carboxylate reductase [Actinomycetota bacterium]